MRAKAAYSRIADRTGADPDTAARGEIVRAVVEVAGSAGYRGATVDTIIKAAGVSRSTFYTHFPNRQEAFAAAFGEAAGALARYVRSRLEAASGDDPIGALETALRGAIEVASRRPQTARLLLSEGIAAGPEMRARYLAELRGVEDAIERQLARAERAGVTIQLPAVELLGGLIGAVAAGLHLQRTWAESLGDDLMAWIRSYRAEPGTPRMGPDGWARLSSDRPLPLPELVAHGRWPRLPRGRAAHAAAATAALHRDRILRATASLARSRGYHAMTVTDVVSLANVSRNVFYEHFDSKGAAISDAQILALGESIGKSAAAFATPGPWPTRIWRGVDTLFTHAARNPDFAALQFLETYAVGDLALRRVFESRDAYELFLEEGYRQRDEAAALPRLCSQLVGGAVYALMQRVMLEDRAGRIVKLIPRATFVAIAPFVGVEEALASVVSLSRTRPSVGRQEAEGTDYARS